MKEYTIKHKYCDCVAHIVGFDFYDACRRAGYDPAVWVVV